MRVFHKLFPNINKCRRVINESREVIYLGVEWKTLPSRTYIDQTDRNNLLNPKYQCLILKHSNDSATILMTSDTVSNGNILMKEIILNFNNQTWSLKVRGTEIDLEKLSISNHFDSSKENLDEIFYVTSKIDICIGLEVVNKKHIPVHVRTEEISFISNENSYGLRMRSRSCNVVLNWLAIGETCRTCTKNLNNFKNEMQDRLINLNKYDNNDLSIIFDEIFPNSTKEMQDFFMAQHNILHSQVNNEKRVWDKSVIKTCLNIWARSPKVYQDLVDSNIFKLPSGRHLRRFKNCTIQRPGISEDILHWMRNTADKIKLQDSGFYGGILHDEAKIQQDLVIKKKGDVSEIIGWVDTGEECQNLRIIKDNKVEQKLATEVLQVTFLGHTGFRFPLVHYPTDGIKASELYIIIWDVISHLQSWGFVVDFVMQDGGQQNREFTRLHFLEDPKAHEFMTNSLVHPNQKIGLCQDFSHNVKKLRNAVLSSGIQPFHTRLLTRNDKVIAWDQWFQAAKWDERTNSRLIHHKLTSSHLQPDSAEKMRNHLAEDVLDENMLNLLRCYQKSLHKGSDLDSVIEFLENTSKIIKFFRDPRPIVSMSDGRIHEIKQVLIWFQSWRDEVSRFESLTAKQKEKMLPSSKCLDDISSCISVFLNVCSTHTSRYKGQGLTPSRFNSDLAENIFCQQRGLYNGNCTNLNYYSYCSTMNNIILGQSSKSSARKSNAGFVRAEPYSFNADVPVVKRKKSIRV